MFLKADEVPGYARPTTSSQQRYRKTPPLTDYLDDTALSTSTWPWASLPPTQGKEKRDLDVLSPTSVSVIKFRKYLNPVLDVQVITKICVFTVNIVCILMFKKLPLVTN